MLSRNLIYLDCQATTPVDPRVLDAMLPYFVERFGNPSSMHHAGAEAAAAVARARKHVSSLINAKPSEIVFTSGATESNNLAIKGIAEGYARTGHHIVTTTIEHRSVLDPCMHLQKLGWKITFLPVDKCGRVDPADLSHALTSSTVLVSVMHANNEIGTVINIEEIGAICRTRGVLFHIDASQTAGRIPIDTETLPVDLLSISAHKMYGPKGMGALFVRSGEPRIRLEPQIDGGGHESGRRSGTLNTPGIVGLGKSAEICMKEMHVEQERIAKLRDALETGLRELPGTTVHGDILHRLAGNLSIAFSGIRADELLRSLPGIAASTGSACSSERPGTSHVLKAIGLDPDTARATIRLSPGRFTTDAEIKAALASIRSSILHLRGRDETIAGSFESHGMPETGI